jgi:hypothetical protein
LFKEVFETEMYLSKNIPSRYRSAFAKFRCGVTPLRIETGRYENKNVNERVCFICHDQIEYEKHVLLYLSKTFQFIKKLTIHQEYKKLFLLLKILKQVLATVSYQCTLLLLTSLRSMFVYLLLVIYKLMD